MTALAWFGVGVLLGAVITALYYRHRFAALVLELEASRARLQSAVNRSQPKE